MMYFFLTLPYKLAIIYLILKRKVNIKISC